jgi:hypothetical protein
MKAQLKGWRRLATPGSNSLLAAQQLDRLLSRCLNQVTVPPEIAESEIRHSALLRSEQLTGPTQL